MLVEERQHPVIEQICRRDRYLAIVQLGAGDLGVGVDEGLLLYSAGEVKRFRAFRFASIGCLSRGLASLRDRLFGPPMMGSEERSGPI